jgi:hypothetical protein
MLGRLEAYERKRTAEYEAKNKKPYNFYLFFLIPTGDSYQLKMQAIRKLKDDLNGNPVKYTVEELLALTCNRLGRIVNSHSQEWPPGFAAQYQKYLDSLSSPMFFYHPVP